MKRPSPYYDLERSAAAAVAGKHREIVGGLWEEVGKLQFDFIHQRGLSENMYLLDVGCGCFRGGVHFVRFLATGHYFGIDISQELLDVGYDREIASVGLANKLPRTNLACNGEFLAEHFGISFDIALAHSLFTHLPLTHIKLCLRRIAKVVRPGGRFFATVFLATSGHDWRKPLSRSRVGITTYPTKNPYHYRGEDLLSCASNAGWHGEIIDDWGHPRDQSMLILSRLDTVGP